MRILRALGIPALALLIALTGFSLLSSSQLDAVAQAAPIAQDTDAMTETEAITATATVTESMTMTEMETIREADEMMEGEEAAETDSPVLIQLRDEVVTSDEFDRAFMRAMHMFASREGVPINDTTYDFFADLRDQYLEQFTFEQVLLAEADDQGIEVTEDEVESQLRDFRASFPSESAYQTAIRTMGFADEAELIDYIQDSTAINAVIAGLLDDIDVSEDDIRAFYEDNISLFRVEPGVILPLEQVQDQIAQLLERQELSDRVLELRTEQAVEVFTGNLTPFEDILLRELDIAEEVPDMEAAPDTVGQTATMTDVISIQVGDQVIPELTLTVDRVFSVGPGWIVIHANDDGAPGEVLGYEAVPDGVSENVAVVLDTEPAVGDILWAMLHEDTGEANVFEFPDGDPPVIVDDNIVMDMLSVVDMEMAAPDTSSDTTAAGEEIDLESESTLEVAGAIGPVELQALNSDVYGSYIANGEGQALYTFVGSDDADVEVTCDEACMRAWPPVLTESTPHTTIDDMDAALAGTVETPIGLQATYNGYPLHYSVLDAYENDTAGQGVESWGASWHLIDPEGSIIPSVP